MLAATNLLTFKLYSCYFKQSGVGNFVKVGHGHFTSDYTTLVLLQQTAMGLLIKSSYGHK